MIRVIFICLGNICRSPMAELIFKRMIAERGLEDKFSVISRATSSCEEGNGIYPPARRELAAHGITEGHRSQVLTREELAQCDYALVMDHGNLRDASRLAGGAHAHKVRLLCSFTARPREVADPWYTRDFARAYADISEGCEGFLQFLEREKAM